jgi:hypothetical protein
MITPEKESSDKPECFGELNTVFPLRSDGLRVTPVSCLQCVHKTACLRTAMGRRQGLTVREEMIDRAYRGGVIGFFQRWSQKKSLHRQKQSSDKNHTS